MDRVPLDRDPQKRLLGARWALVAGLGAQRFFDRALPGGLFPPATLGGLELAGPRRSRWPRLGLRPGAGRRREDAPDARCRAHPGEVRRGRRRRLALEQTSSAGPSCSRGRADRAHLARPELRPPREELPRQYFFTVTPGLVGGAMAHDAAPRRPRARAPVVHSSTTSTRTAASGSPRRCWGRVCAGGPAGSPPRCAQGSAPAVTIGEDLRFLAAVPSRADLRVEVPEDALSDRRRAPGRVRHAPRRHLAPREAESDRLDAAVEFLLGLVDVVRRAPPTGARRTRAAGAPFPDEKHPGRETRVTILLHLPGRRGGAAGVRLRVRGARDRRRRVDGRLAGAFEARPPRGGRGRSSSTSTRSGRSQDGRRPQTAARRTGSSTTPMETRWRSGCSSTRTARPRAVRLPVRGLLRPERHVHLRVPERPRTSSSWPRRVRRGRAGARRRRLPYCRRARAASASAGTQARASSTWTTPPRSAAAASRCSLGDVAACPVAVAAVLTGQSRSETVR